MEFNDTGENTDLKQQLNDLDSCPRCGHLIDEIIWGQTNCDNCGLHFECC